MKSSYTFFLFVTIFLPTLILASFDKDDIDDSFSLRQGSPNVCAEKLELDEDDLTIKADDIELDNKDCEGGSIRLTRSPNSTDSQRFFRSKSTQIGNFLAGRVSGTLTCGTAKIEDRTEIILLEPEKDIEIRWSEVFGSSNGDLAKEKKSAKLDDDTKYAIVGDKCFYEETNIADRVCFPHDATVTTMNGQVTMQDLKIGMQVLVGKDTYSPVIAWTHQDNNIHYPFVKVTTKNENIIRLTKGHYIYADNQLMTARNLKIGMTLKTATAQDDMIIKIEKEYGRGLYNPQTAHGDIVVDGIIATTYTNTITPNTAHALLAPIRAAFCAANNLFNLPSSSTIV